MSRLDARAVIESAENAVQDESLPKNVVKAKYRKTIESAATVVALEKSMTEGPAKGEP